MILALLKNLTQYRESTLGCVLSKELTYSPQWLGQVFCRSEKESFGDWWPRDARLHHRTVDQALTRTCDHAIGCLEVKNWDARLSLDDWPQKIDYQGSRCSGYSSPEKLLKVWLRSLLPVLEDSICDHGDSRHHEFVGSRSGRRGATLLSTWFLPVGFGKTMWRGRHRCLARGYSLTSTLDCVPELEPNVLLGGHGR